MQTSHPALSRSSALSTARDLHAIVARAHECRSIEQAIADPCTLRLIEHAHGKGAVVVETSAVITRAMGYFAAGRALNPLQVTLLAETLLEKYPHETMSDVALFLHRAAMGEFDEGKTFGALDIPTAMRWWRQHLDEKSAAMERVLKSEDAEADETGKALLGLPGIRDAVAAMSMEAKEKKREADAIARMERLKADLPSMDRDALRQAWKVYTRPNERALIQAQAARSGYFNDELKAAQEAIDEQTRS